MTAMTDAVLARFFRALVAGIAERDPLSLHQPIPVARIADTFLPYRSARRGLGIDTHEDYELLVVRLAAGEGGLVTTTPAEARQAFAAEAASANPDLGVLQRHAEAEVVLAGEPLAYALGPDPVERAYGPPAAGGRDGGTADARATEAGATEPAAEAEAEHDVLPLDGIRAAPPPAPLAAERCLYCGGTLPGGRPVNFCPHCGQSQTAARCPECRSEVEVGWRHCVTCGCALTP
ncbi:MAG TPA: zinc ribbon domain-containing protein [Gemmatimonadales bacterium]|nr:zinc ribbon domain-containing protein [Gemmatimonadales bacterium]